MRTGKIEVRYLLRLDSPYNDNLLVGREKESILEYIQKPEHRWILDHEVFIVKRSEQIAVLAGKASKKRNTDVKPYNRCITN